MVVMKLKVRKAASCIVGWAVGRSTAGILVDGVNMTGTVQIVRIQSMKKNESVNLKTNKTGHFSEENMTLSARQRQTDKMERTT